MDYNSFYMKSARKYNFSRLDEGDVFDSTLSYITSHIPSGYLNILDVGCGTGEYGFALKQMGYNVYGIDKSPAQVEIASKKICAKEADILSLTQMDNSVDVVLMIMMVHQICAADLKVAFAEVVRILKPGGIAIIKTCFEDEIENRITSKYFPSCLLFDKMRFPSKEQLISANHNLTLRFCDKLSVSINITKEKLVQKFQARGASNIGILSDEELEKGIIQMLEDFKDNDMVKLDFDNTFLVFECCKKQL